MRLRSIDIWSVDADALCITTNGAVNKQGHAVMGRGVALQAKKRFPGIEKTFGAQLSHNGNVVQVLPFVLNYRGPIIVAFPVKHHWRDKADLGLIAESARQLLKLSMEWKWNRIVLPRPGCGNGGRTWAEVEPLLAPVLDDRFLVVDK